MAKSHRTRAGEGRLICYALKNCGPHPARVPTCEVGVQLDKSGEQESPSGALPRAAVLAPFSSPRNLRSKYPGPTAAELRARYAWIPAFAGMTEGRGGDDEGRKRG